MTHLEDDELVLYYYAEGDGLPESAAHLDACAGCRERWAALRASLDAIAASAVPDRDASYGRMVWARVQPHLDTRGPRGARAWSWAGVFTWPRLMLAGGMAALLVAAFVVGRTWPLPAPQVPITTQAGTAMTAEGQQRVLYAAVGDHLERSAMVLIELANRHDSQPADISGEQAFTGDLVAANRLYRQSASRQGEAGLASVLEQLERVLVEITNSPSPMPAAQLDSLRRRIDDEGLLFKIRVLESQARQRQENPAPARPATSKS